MCKKLDNDIEEAMKTLKKKPAGNLIVMRRRMDRFNSHDSETKNGIKTIEQEYL